MPPLFVLAAVGAGVVVGYQLLKRVAASTSADVSETSQEQAEPKEPKNLGELELDRKSGVYKPRRP
jgi:hypothetical protein